MLGDYMEWRCLTTRDFCLPFGEMPIRETMASEEEEQAEDSSEEAEKKSRDVLRKQTKHDMLCRQALAQVSLREKLLGDLYPFFKNGNQLQLKSRQTFRMRLYVFFLMCSHLGSLRMTDRSILTNDFERVGKFTASSLYPEHETIIFGTSDRHHSKGNLKTRLEALCSGINATLDPKFTPSPRNNGDAGLDIISWQKFSPYETATHLPVALFQCGCTEDIDKAQDKQSDCSLEKWYRRLHYAVAYPHMITPLCTRHNNGHWYEPCDLTTVWIDRIRLMWILSKNSSRIFPSLKSNDLVTQALSKEQCIESNN